jgi:hypothetical protein
MWLKKSCAAAESGCLLRLAEFIAIGIRELSELVERVSMNSRNIDGWPGWPVTGWLQKSPVFNVGFFAEGVAADR